MSRYPHEINDLLPQLFGITYRGFVVSIVVGSVLCSASSVSAADYSVVGDADIYGGDANTATAANILVQDADLISTQTALGNGGGSYNPTQLVQSNYYNIQANDPNNIGIKADLLQAESEAYAQYQQDNSHATVLGKGGNGGKALSTLDMSYIPSSEIAKSTRVRAFGGNGGTGDSVFNSVVYSEVPGLIHGNGGNGGNAETKVRLFNGYEQSGVLFSGYKQSGVEAYSKAGDGGSGVNGGNGGNAKANAEATTTTDSLGTTPRLLYVSADAFGGAGGDVYDGFLSNNFHADGITGNAGTAQASARGVALFSDTDVVVSATQVGGAGGRGYYGAHSGNGANSIITNAVSGFTTGNLALNQTAVGGNAGHDIEALTDQNGNYLHDSQGNTELTLKGTPGDAGNAISQLTYVDQFASSVSATTIATGGSFGRESIADGSAVAQTTLTSTRNGSNVYAYAVANAGKVLNPDSSVNFSINYNHSFNQANAMASAGGVGVDTFVGARAVATVDHNLNVNERGTFASSNSFETDGHGNSVTAYSKSFISGGEASAITRVGDDAELVANTHSLGNVDQYEGTNSRHAIATGYLGQYDIGNHITVIGSGFLGGVSNGSNGGTVDADVYEHPYLSDVTYQFSLNYGNELLFGMKSVDMHEFGRGFNRALLTITDNGTVKMNDEFTTYSQLASLGDTIFDLGTTGGSHKIEVIWSMVAAGMDNGANLGYGFGLKDLTLIQPGEFAMPNVSPVPLPSSLPLFLSGVLSIFVLRKARKRYAC